MSETIKIIGSYTSPFSRIVRMIAEEAGIQYEMDPTLFYLKNSPEQEQHVHENNPLMKIPVLVHGDRKIIESKVIATYLLTHFKPSNDFRTGFPATVDEENIYSTISGVLDAGVTRFMMKTAHPEINMESGYMERSLERMHSGLQWLEKQTELGKSFGLPEALLICVIDWFKKRNVVELEAYKNLQAICNTFAERPSVVKTRIPQDA